MIKNVKRQNYVFSFKRLLRLGGGVCGREELVSLPLLDRGFFDSDSDDEDKMSYKQGWWLDEY